MPTHENGGSLYQNRAAELQNLPSHTHRAAEAEHLGKPEQLTGQEHPRPAGEHSDALHPQPHAGTVGHGVAAFGHDDIANLAHQLWRARGCPQGSPDEDWFKAAQILRSRAHTG